MSKENWEYANKRAGRLFIKCGIFYLAIMTMALFLIIYMELEKVVHEIYVIVPVILPIFLIGYIIYKVQKELKIRNT